LGCEKSEGADAYDVLNATMKYIHPSIHFFIPIFMGRGGKVKSDFHDKRGRGVRQKVIFDDEGGSGGLDPP
jgi:hypothetical protein